MPSRTLPFRAGLGSDPESGLGADSPCQRAFPFPSLWSFLPPSAVSLAFCSFKALCHLVSVNFLYHLWSVSSPESRARPAPAQATPVITPRPPPSGIGQASKHPSPRSVVRAELPDPVLGCVRACMGGAQQSLPEMLLICAALPSGPWGSQPCSSSPA